MMNEVRGMSEIQGVGSEVYENLSTKEIILNKVHYEWLLKRFWPTHFPKFDQITKHKIFENNFLFSLKTFQQSLVPVLEHRPPTVMRIHISTMMQVTFWLGFKYIPGATQNLWESADRR